MDRREQIHAEWMQIDVGEDVKCDWQTYIGSASVEPWGQKMTQAYVIAIDERLRFIESRQRVLYDQTDYIWSLHTDKWGARIACLLAILFCTVGAYYAGSHHWF